MIALQDPAWNNLSHAYGTATDIPRLLVSLKGNPLSISHGDEPWHNLWSSLCHQGDVYEASFAAVPHIVATALDIADHIDWSFLLLPVSIEIARYSKDVKVPKALNQAYDDAIAALPQIVSQQSKFEWDQSFSISALAALALGKQKPRVAAAIMNFDDDIIQKVIDLDFD